MAASTKKFLDENGLLYYDGKIKGRLNTKVDKVTGKGLSTNDLTNELKQTYDETVSKVDQIIAEGGEPNVIETVKVNGTALTPDAEKAVNIDLSGYAKTTDLPTKVSDLTNDGDGTTGSKFATEAYVNTNGGKIDKIKVNGTEQTITNKAVDITVPTKTSDLTNDSNFITNTGDTSGNAGSATQLKNARTIAIGTGATGTATSFNGTSNITIPITDVKDAYITWGGKNISGQISPDDMGCIDEFGHNKLAFLPAGCITVEYTTDGGTTWLDYGLTDEEKVKIVTTSGINLSIGKGTATASGGTLTNENCGNYKVRVKISTRNGQGKTSGYLYTQAKKWLLNVTTNGATGTTVLVENRSIANYNNNVNTWTTVGTYDVSGWSGWNSIPYNYTFGGGSNQTGQIADVRFTLSIEKVNVNYNCAAAFLDFRLIGQTNWSMPSELARTGHLYTMDVDQNATFPKKIMANDFSAKKMIENLR